MASTPGRPGHIADPDARRRRARLAAITRHHPNRPDLTVDDRRYFKATAAERYIRDLVDTDPPLTGDQRAHLAGLLAAGGDPDTPAGQGGSR